MPLVTQAQLDEANAKADELQAATDEEQQEVANFIAAIEAENQSLRDQIAAGGSEETLLAITAKMDAAIADIRTTIPNLPPAELKNKRK